MKSTGPFVPAQGCVRSARLALRHPPHRFFPFNFMSKVTAKETEVSATTAEGTSSGTSEGHSVTSTVAQTASALAGAAASPEAKRKPIHTIRLEDCSASIWARESVVQGKPKTFYSLTLERSYKERDGSWKYTKTFDLESLARLISLCQQAGEYITSLQ